MPRLLEGEAPAGLWTGLAGQVTAERFTLADAGGASAIMGANGMTDYGSHVVTVRADMDDAARVKTLAHELGHVRMHDPAGNEQAAKCERCTGHFPPEVGARAGMRECCDAQEASSRSVFGRGWRGTRCKSRVRRPRLSVAVSRCARRGLASGTGRR